VNKITLALVAVISITTTLALTTAAMSVSQQAMAAGNSSSVGKDNPTQMPLSSHPPCAIKANSTAGNSSSGTAGNSSSGTAGNSSSGTAGSSSSGTAGNSSSGTAGNSSSGTAGNSSSGTAGNHIIRIDSLSRGPQDKFLSGHPCLHAQPKVRLA
jgi:hypothetical protein